MIGGLLPVNPERSVASNTPRTHRSKSAGLPFFGGPLNRSQSNDPNRNNSVRTVHPASAPARASYRLSGNLDHAIQLLLRFLRPIPDHVLDCEKIQ